MLSHVRILASTHRNSTTQNERKAAEYIKNFFLSRGISTTIEDFKAPSTFLALSLIYTISWLSFLLSFLFPFAGIFTFLSIIFYLAEVNTFPTVSLLLPKRNSQNVIGRLNKGKVVIIAHYDSAKYSPIFHPIFSKNFRLFFLIVSLSIFLLPFFYILSFSSLSFPFLISFLPCGILFFSTVALLYHEIGGKPVSGANDNASGVAVLLELAEILSKERERDERDVWFLATGAEEIGLCGIVSFLRKYGKELKDSYFINLDNVGGGKLIYTTEEGMLFRMRTSRFLVEKAKNLGIHGKPFRAMSTDCTAVLARGYSGMTMIGIQDGTIPDWHRITDVAENVKEENLRLAAKIIVEIVEQINNKEK
jgi:hypothetical protein